MSEPPTISERLTSRFSSTRSTPQNGDLTFSQGGGTVRMKLETSRGRSREQTLVFVCPLSGWDLWWLSSGDSFGPGSSVLVAGVFPSINPYALVILSHFSPLFPCDCHLVLIWCMSLGVPDPHRLSCHQRCPPYLEKYGCKNGSAYAPSPRRSRNGSMPELDVITSAAGATGRLTSTSRSRVKGTGNAFPFNT